MIAQPTRTLPERLKPYRFTPETARLNAAKSAASRRMRLRPLPENPARAEPQADKPTVNPRLALVCEQIDRTRKVLNGKMQAHHRASLLKALDTLLDREREYLRVTKVGTEKPLPERAASRSLLDGPI